MIRSAEEILIRHRYRLLVLTGKVRISFESARALVGPDCAFHLYGSLPLARALRTRRRGASRARRAGRKGKERTP